MSRDEHDVIVKFDREARNWSEDQRVNQYFLKTIQSYMNDRLRARGHVFLNEVYDELGMPRTIYGQLNGWLLVNGKDVGFEVLGEPNEDGSIILKFSTDGEIYEHIEDIN